MLKEADAGASVKESWIALALAMTALSACVSVRYQRSGSEITPRPGETLVFGRLRFLHDGREFFPWEARLVPDPLPMRRHLWLLRLGSRAISAEVHPDSDGSLAIWLAGGDYALLGSIEATPVPGAATVEVVALLRVHTGAVSSYAGELTMQTEGHEGGHVRFEEFGVKSVELQPIGLARATLEQRLGRLPEPPVVSAWCVGPEVPGFDDPGLARRAGDLLDRGCQQAL